MSEEAVSFRLRGRPYSLTKSKVEDAVEHAVPAEVDTYSVAIAGRKYPPKQVLALALNLAPSEFISTDATRTLKKLGFEIQRTENTEATNKTESEQLLEMYLLSRGLTEFEFEPELDGCPQRPDYLLNLRNTEILLEVKQFEATPADFRLGFGQSDPYGPIREKIEAGRRKFKHLKDHLCCLVLFNREKPLVSLQWQFIYGAMLGNIAFRMPFDRVRGLVADQSQVVYSGGGKMHRYRKNEPLTALEPQNSTISAVLVLQQLLVGKRRFYIQVARKERELDRKLTLEELHDALGKAQGTERDWSLTQLRIMACMNPYARIPLPREVFRGPYDEQYGLDETNDHITRLYAGEQIEQLESQEGAEKSPVHRAIENE